MNKTNLVDAFLVASAIAYYVAVFLPKRCTKNSGDLPWEMLLSKIGQSLVIEKIGMGLCGTLILGNLLILDNPLAWLAMGILWTFACVASYLGYAKWNVLWKEEVSDTAQIAMWAWDLLIATCCLMKV